ncbi:hypothetical protein [Humibacter sp.]|uniref:hypothetical protein n=1 Tax=Humibacter sp. TaxID=1940291 RepID=UPI003F7CD526
MSLAVVPPSPEDPALVTDPVLPVRSATGPGSQSSAPKAGAGERVFLSRRERRAFEEAEARSAAPHATQVDVRETDARLDDSRRTPEASRAHHAELVPVSTQTGRVRLRAEELARSTDSAPVPIMLPGPDVQASVAPTRRSVRTAPKPATSAEPAASAKPSRSKPAKATGTKRRSPLSRMLSKAVIMLAAAGLVATTAVPAYAQFERPTWFDPTTGKTQTLAVGAVQSGILDRNDFAAHTMSTALDSTLGTVVAPEVQAAAQQLMTAVAQGRLTGSTPDHIFEIRYLAAGEAVPGCGIDYRVLQAIAFALTKFNTVGVSDINRHCTGQIEGAGTASAHYADGGGHAVDFFRLNGHALTGGDSDSIKLIEDLDAVVPTDSTVGQQNCRSGLSLSHFKQIDDTCNHVHVDFLDAKAATLLGG